MVSHHGWTGLFGAEPVVQSAPVCSSLRPDPDQRPQQDHGAEPGGAALGAALRHRNRCPALALLSLRGAESNKRLPPVRDPLLLESATQLAQKIRRRETSGERERRKRRSLT
uniref:Uncharacterized protein n=1 Tax=Knipowitschia caucasica TaxID=637954 RepID=A0AAV2KQB1_KNICA